MHPREIKTALSSLTAGFGKNAHAFAMVMDGAWCGDGNATVSVYPEGSGKEGVSASADTWEQAIAEVTAKLDVFRAEREAKAVRRMALAIIDITASLGDCTVAALVDAGFTQEEVDRHGDDACATAAGMARCDFFITRQQPPTDGEG